MKELTSLRISDLFKRSKEPRRILGWIKTRDKAVFKNVNRRNTNRGTIKSISCAKI